MNEIINEYQADGYDLTVRQLYYQFVARDLVLNNDKEYGKLLSVVNNGRLAGLIDWDAITDRTRPSQSITHWDSPEEIITAIGRQFHIDTRSDQDYYFEVWVEKDALVGVLEKVCTRLDIPYLSCRGFISQSSMWEAAQRFIGEEDNGKETFLIHLSDHDPSGIDMSRDIQDRFTMFRSNCQVRRIALTMDQVERYNPPPNFAKEADSRHAGYVEKYGTDSWELDALDPRTITRLIEDAVEDLTDEDRREALLEEQEIHRANILKVAKKWNSVVEMLSKKKKKNE